MIRKSGAGGDARFRALTPRDTAEGAARRVGVEIEFGGLTEAEVATLAAEVLGGQAREAGDFRHVVEGSVLGEIEILLDTAWRRYAENPIAERGLELGRAVVPVEIVTEPLDPVDLPVLDALRARLREAGATGSRDGLFLGFGVHLNAEVANRTVDAILPVLRAYALAEDWLRARRPIDPSRRILPFVAPYPRSLVDALAEAESWSLDRMIREYLDHAPSRNHGLDMLPVLRDLDEAAVVEALGDAAASVSARPTYHFRLPDCRIDEPGWSLAVPWDDWATVEEIAADGELLDSLAEAWRDHRASLTTIRPDWAANSGAIIAEARQTSAGDG